jgi:hypothetical protein
MLKCLVDLGDGMTDADTHSFDVINGWIEDYRGKNKAGKLAKLIPMDQIELGLSQD